MIYRLCLLILSLCGPWVTASANQVSARLIAPVTAVMPGETLWLGLALDIAPGWNTYWQNPGATGLPPTLTEASTQLDASLLFPTPETKPFGDDASLLTYGYVDQVTHPFQWTVPDAAEGQWEFVGEARWLVCREICIPESQTVRLSLPVVTDTREVHRSTDLLSLDAARARIPTDYPGRLTIVAPNRVWIEGLSGRSILDAMPETSGEVAGMIERTQSTPEGTWITLDRPLTLSEFTEAHWVIRTPDAGVRVRLDPSMAVPASLNTGLSLAWVLVLALAGGLLLNLMPCVFPVLSIKALSIAKQSSQTRTEVRRGALLYAAGIVASMSVLAGLMVALRASGAQIGWGFQLQTPWFVGLLVYVFVLLGLWLYGWLQWGGQLAGFGQSLTEGQSSRAEFFTGVLAVIVATPCTAPFMGVAMGYTLTQPWWITWLVFATLGLGLALPLLVFAVAPGLSHHLPKPGVWMERLKQLLAFPVFATAIWLLWVLVRQAGADAMPLILGGALLLIFGLWLRQGASGWSRGLGVLVILAAIAALPALARWTPETQSESAVTADSEPYSSSQLEAYVNSGQTVFINMTADWCITCKVTEQRLLNTQAVEDLFNAAGVVRMTGDWTRYDATITAYLNRFDRVGVPLYVVHYPDREPKILSQFPTFSELEAALSR